MNKSVTPNAEALTLINTFDVEPDRAEALIKILSEATEQVMRHLPGFVFASLHLSLDRRHVANYAQWRSKTDFDAMLKNPQAQVHMREAAEMADSFAPLLYEFRESYAVPAAA